MSKFINALIPTYHEQHVKAAIGEAERLGYTVAKDCLALTLKDHPSPVQILHLRSDGTYFGFCYFTLDELLRSNDEALRNAIVVKKLRKLRGLHDPVVTQSQDNQAALIVRPKYEVVDCRNRERAQAILDAQIVANSALVAPYGRSTFPPCECLGVDENTRKTCRMVKAYGGTCGKPFAKLQKATQADKDNVIEWVRPKAENPLVNRAALVLAKAFVKVKGALVRVYNHLRGGL